MGPNPKGLTLLPEPPTSTGAPPPSSFPISNPFPTPPLVSPSPIPSISCFEAGAILIPTVGQHGSVPLARPPPAAAVREPLPRRTLLRKSSETLGDMENLTSCIQPSCYTAKNLSIK